MAIRFEKEKCLRGGVQLLACHTCRTCAARGTERVPHASRPGAAGGWGQAAGGGRVTGGGRRQSSVARLAASVGPTRTGKWREGDGTGIRYRLHPAPGESASEVIDGRLIKSNLVWKCVIGTPTPIWIHSYSGLFARKYSSTIIGGEFTVQNSPLFRWDLWKQYIFWMSNRGIRISLNEMTFRAETGETRDLLRLSISSLFLVPSAPIFAEIWSYWEHLYPS